MGYHLNARYGAAGNAPGRLWRGLVAVILSFALFLQGAIPVQAALFGSFGVKDEKELGRKFDVLVRSRMPLVEDPEIKGYIQSIVDRLSKTFPPQPDRLKSSCASVIFPLSIRAISSTSLISPSR